MAVLWCFFLASLPIVPVMPSDVTYPVVNVGTGYRLSVAASQCHQTSWKIDSDPVGVPCLKVVTSKVSDAGGDLILWVTTSSGGMKEETKGFFDKGSTVWEKCYWEDILSVKVQGDGTNGWVGSISYSPDGGAFYMAMTCLSCSGPSNSGADVVVDSDNDNPTGDTRCVENEICTFVKRKLNCVKVVTAGSTNNDGPLTVYVDAGNGQVTEASGSHDLNEVVLDKCYDTIVSVKAKAESSDAWVGAITRSYDGGNTYANMECSDCTGPQNTTSKIEFDGAEDNKAQADTWCVGKTCTIVNRPLYCVQLVTSGGASDDGYLDLSVNAGSGLQSEASGIHAKNSVVLDKCYPTEVVSVTVESSESNGWVGALSYSSDGGYTYAAMTCSDCSGPSNSGEKFVVDGDSSYPASNTRCVSGATCTFVKRKLHCVNIVTGGNSYEDGPLKVHVKAGSGDVEEASGNQANNAVTLDKCYDNFAGLTVQAVDGNGWAGAITYSSNGGITYAAMECKDCTGTQKTTSKITADEDASSTLADTKCLSKRKCEVVKRPPHCVKVVTGGGSNEDGPLPVYIDAGSGDELVASAGNHDLNEVFVDKCYETEIVSVKIQSTSTNGWAGAITHSSNGGFTYAPMECTDCTGPQKTTSKIMVDKDVSNWGDTRCMGGNSCTMVKRAPNCVKVVTGDSSGADGTLTVYIDTGSGDDSEASGSYDRSAVVLDKCYETEIVSMKAKATSDNGWLGAFTHSYDGGHTYAAMECSNCGGTKWSTDSILFDGNNDGTGANTKCMNGEKCTITKIGRPSLTTNYILQAVYDDGAAYLGHNGLVLGMHATVTSGAKWSIESIGDTNCTLKAVVALNSGESILGSNGKQVQMVNTTGDRDNEKWNISGFC